MSSLHVIGLKSGFEDKIVYINSSYNILIPEHYRCSILDSIVIIEHVDGVKAKVKWR